MNKKIVNKKGRKAYTSPKLKKQGSIEDLTLSTFNEGSGDLFLSHILTS